MITAKQAATEIVDVMNSREVANYDRESWGYAVSDVIEVEGSWQHLVKDEVLDAIEDIIFYERYCN